MKESIKMYGTPVCPMVPPVRGVLNRANADFEYIDIMQDTEALVRVKEINDGNASVPTLAFADGSTLTEPSLGQLKAKLKTLGYEVAAPSLIDLVRENLLRVIPALFLIGIGIAKQEAIWIVFGAVILGMAWWNGR